MGAKIGERTRLGNIQMTFPEQVGIGSYCLVEDGVRFRPGGAWKGSSISIGYNTFVGFGSQFNVGAPLAIGNNCMIAPGCIFTDANHSFDRLDIPIKQQGCSYKSISVADDVWIGSGAIILAGVNIGNGAVIAAGAVVRDDVESFEIWGGVPAKKIKSRCK
jgi:acetyltransferase-like isoleucine patch superfamily enzyme